MNEPASAPARSLLHCDVRASIDDASDELTSRNLFPLLGLSAVKEKTRARIGDERPSKRRTQVTYVR